MVNQRVVQVVWAHPRADSLTASVVADVISELTSAGVRVDEIDLYRQDFDPVLYPPDEPDFSTLDNVYSDEVMAFTQRTREASAVIFIFPVWWYSLPARMKGFIDRVWNYGTFYGGGRRLGIPAVRWIALAGDTEEKYRKRHYDSLMDHHLNTGIAGYCGVSDSQLLLLYNTAGTNVADMDQHAQELKDAARRVARELVGAV
ncbi:NAD(P)H oxidoreductase [Kocuria sp.]|uniref:NAD(P)H oxidoreductase n=1 Tax=Kocuria sp. TaxID=1871328 RepID=UPI0026DFD56C|nr:NAD(P)H oxidoreductase [Kocuria sp.]MDO5617536.1 NAD(P)H oxidoreductase [Kocuria sp.]